MIVVRLPTHLQSLAKVTGPIHLEVGSPVTQRAVLDALEARFPVLEGTIRDRESHRRRAFVRFFGGTQDLSHEPDDAPLPAQVAAGEEPFHIVGAMAGG